MERERILVTVKTYPTLSQTHIELVCTAGFREDGSWVRIYPVPFRLLEPDKQFPKWTWIDLPLVRRHKDKRPESYSPADRDDIVIGNTMSPADNWAERRRWALQKGTVWDCLDDLIAAAKSNACSLATFRPRQMLSFEWKQTEEDWDATRVSVVEAQLRQIDFLEDENLRKHFKPVEKVPYDFYYRFRDSSQREPRMRILDWEIGMLYWNCRKSVGSDEEALKLVKQKYEEDFFRKDLHLFLGTTFEWHERAPNPWVVIGVLPLPPDNRMQLL